MSEVKVLEFINKIVKKYEYISRDIALTDKLKDDIGLDSLGILTLVDEVENEFELALETDDLATNPETINDLIKLIMTKIG